MANDSRLIQEHLSLLLPYFSEQTTLAEESAIIGRFLTAMMPVDTVLLLRLDADRREAAGWSHDGRPVAKALIQRLYATADALLAQAQGEAPALGPKVDRLLGLTGGVSAILYTVYCGKYPCGLLVALRVQATWQADEQDLLSTLRGLMGAASAIRISMDMESRSSFVLNTVMDRMNTSIYITDVDTDRILFMNQTMKEAFDLPQPEGKVCWQSLQRGMTTRCGFCPVSRLLQSGADDPVIQWDEVNTVTGRAYRNYDSLIRWMDGSVVHLQQSIDITELKTANTDELTQLLSRRPGKVALQATLDQAQVENRLVTVCFYDVNCLKEVNDQFGHAAGDRLLSTIAQSVQAVLQDGEYAFRLSGDEFVVVFLSGQRNTQQRLSSAQWSLLAQGGPYEMGFCFGLTEVLPEHSITADEALLLADERMYEQKRRFHILRNESRRRAPPSLLDSQHFHYDKDRLYDALAKSTDSYPFVCNMKTGGFRYAPAMVEEFGLPGEIIENAAAVWGAQVHEDDRAAFLEANQDIIDGRALSHCVEYRVANRRGQWVWVRCRGQVELDENGDASLFAGFITNLDRKDRIDHLTGLFNKLEFEAQITSLIDAYPRTAFGVMILGIDDLKHINDLYDRTFGDEVIRLTSHRLQTLLPVGASLFRLDGDEFGVVARGFREEDLHKLYRSINYSFETQQEHKGKKYYCALSAGCALCPRDADNYLALMKYAGYALEYGKKHGKKCCISYSSGILDHRSRSLEMVEALRESVENDYEGFSLRFQPLVEAATGRLLGAEALARWQCQRFGLVSPVEFIPLLEQTGMILPVGKWVLATALRLCKPWLATMPGFVLDVNLSYLQLRGDDFPPFLYEALRENVFPARNLVLELTESQFVQENQHVREIFSHIRRHGIRIAMDDFGTGYSTLSTLKDTPADIVKIDKTFIRNIRTNTFDATFIRFVVALCHDVGVKVCLEGIEAEEEYQIVSDMGLDMIQGYYFGVPLTEEEFKVRLREG